MTGIIEQIHSEVSERAASPEGLLRLIHMVMTEVSNLDVKSPQFNSHYVSLVQTYVLEAGRQVWWPIDLRARKVESIGISGREKHNQLGSRA